MTQITGDIAGLAFGGKGILRHDGMVVFVPFTAPGDLISCEITRRKKNFAEGKLLSLINSSPLRTTPPCPYFGECGGCQLQHLDYQAQLAYKQQSVIDALNRIGGLKLPPLPPIIPAATQWAYRRHVKLKMIPSGQGYKTGYTSIDNATLLPITECPIFVDRSDPILCQVHAVVEQLHATPHEAKLTILKQDQNRFILMFDFKQLPPNALQVLESALKQYPAWSGVLINTPQRSTSLQNTSCSIDIEGLHIALSPRSFIQNHPEQSLNIYKEIVKLATTSPVLDLYCGIGISSLLLARQGRTVAGIEFNQEAVKLARQNAEANRINAQFICADVNWVLKNKIRELAPGLVIVNPPRTGLDNRVLQELLAARPREILYISCMPSTLARDLGSLCPDPYRIEHCQAFDMFPQTGHVETLVHLNHN